MINKKIMKKDFASRTAQHYVHGDMGFKARIYLHRQDYLHRIGFIYIVKAI